LIFQVLIIRQPLPDVASLITGTLFVILGLTLFIQDWNKACFRLVNRWLMLCRKGSLFWLLAFAFCLGFGAAVAEPALIAVAEKAANIASAGNIIEQTNTARIVMLWDYVLQWPCPLVLLF